MANKKVSDVEDAYLDKMLVAWIRDNKPDQVGEFLDSFIKARAPELKEPKLIRAVMNVPIYEHDLTAPDGLRAVFLKRLRAAQPPAKESTDDVLQQPPAAGKAPGNAGGAKAGP